MGLLFPGPRYILKIDLKFRRKDDEKKYQCNRDDFKRAFPVSGNLRLEGFAGAGKDERNMVDECLEICV